MSDKAKVLANVKTKLGRIPLHLGISDEDIELCLSDTIREMKLGSINNVTADSDTELYVEVRTMWWALGIARNSESTDFKYSTGSDGKTVDKTAIPKMIDDIMDKFDAQFKQWKSSNAYGILNIPRREPTVLVGDQ